MVLWTLFGAVALAVLAGFGAWRVSRTKEARSHMRFMPMDGILMALLFIPYGVFKALVLQKKVIEFAVHNGALVASIVETLTLIALVFAAYFISWSINRIR